MAIISQYTPKDPDLSAITSPPTNTNKITSLSPNTVLVTISAGLVDTVQFKVTVTTIPTSFQVKNSAVVTYKYTVNPSIQNEISTSYNTNIVTTEIKVANL